MKLVVGLGNPGPKYAGNRHNVGFMVLDELFRRAAAAPPTSKFKGTYAKTVLCNEPVLLLKPMTFMNLSGESTSACAKWFDVALEDCIVIHDELDVEYGDVRVKSGGGHAGHNGLRSIFQHQGRDFARVRFGIGRPAHGSVHDHVLGDFSADQRIDLELNVGRAADAVERVLRDGVQQAQSDTNRRKRIKTDKGNPQEENGS